MEGAGSPSNQLPYSILVHKYCFAAYDGVKRALATHYGQTRIHQACYSPRHRRDGRAGTTIPLSFPHILPDPATTSDDYGPDGAAGAWALPPHPPKPQDLPGPGLRAGWSSGPTAARGRHYHTTFRKRACFAAYYARSVATHAVYLVLQTHWPRPELDIDLNPDHPGLPPSLRVPVTRRDGGRPVG